MEEKMTHENKVGNGKKNFAICYVKGDLFDSPGTDSLCHCVSADMRLGKGIALLFKQKYGGIKELQEQKQSPGGLAILKRDSRFIYNLVTKSKYFEKPTYETLEKSLRKMYHHAVQNEVKNISMPKIATGLDRLQWDTVSKIIMDIFSDNSINITVYTL